MPVELLDVAGEWYHDIDARKVYYYPREGEKMQDAGTEVIVPAIETLVQVKGPSTVLFHISVLRKSRSLIRLGCVRLRKAMFLFRQECI